MHESKENVSLVFSCKCIDILQQNLHQKSVKPNRVYAQGSFLLSDIPQNHSQITGVVDRVIGVEPDIPRKRLDLGKSIEPAKV